MPETMELALDMAMQCRSADQALMAPTMNQLAKAFDAKLVFGSACAIIKNGMMYFAAGRRMEPAQVSMFAEKLLDDYQHESLADINAFMIGAAMSKYDEGEFYGSVDIPRLAKWWRSYLVEKAEARERAGREQQSAAMRETEQALASIPGLSEAVNQAVADNKERMHEEARRRRMARLAGTFKIMTDQDLRDSYVKYKDADTRSVILEEAAKRGLLDKSMNEAVRRGEEEARAEAQHLTEHPEELPAIPQDQAS